MNLSCFGHLLFILFDGAEILEKHIVLFNIVEWKNEGIAEDSLDEDSVIYVLSDEEVSPVVKE